MAMSSIPSSIVKRHRRHAQQLRVFVGNEILDLHRSLDEDRIGGRFAGSWILVYPFEHQHTLHDEEPRETLGQKQ
jgi:hypothetical protein